MAVDVVLCEHTGTQTEVSNNVSQHVLRIPITDDLTVALKENIFLFSDEKLVICSLKTRRFQMPISQFLYKYLHTKILNISPLLQNSTKKE